MSSTWLRHKDLSNDCNEHNQFSSKTRKWLAVHERAVEWSVGSGPERHVAYWESVKVVDRIEENGKDENTTVVRERERFSQRLTLLYGDGRSREGNSSARSARSLRFIGLRFRFPEENARFGT